MLTFGVMMGRNHKYSNAVQRPRCVRCKKRLTKSKCKYINAEPVCTDCIKKEKDRKQRTEISGDEEYITALRKSMGLPEKKYGKAKT